MTEGLSPRPRGNQAYASVLQSMGGPIPASAGEPSARALRSSAARAYPRVRGGTFAGTLGNADPLGLSPRPRGNQKSEAEGYGAAGPIPASAGEPLSCCPKLTRWWAYPRVRGGTTDAPPTQNPSSGLSPRPRGNRRSVALSPVASGPIPASAGEPSFRRACPCAVRAYPRVRGGTFDVATVNSGAYGLSPRPRGNHRDR